MANNLKVTFLIQGSPMSRQEIVAAISRIPGVNLVVATDLEGMDSDAADDVRRHNLEAARALLAEHPGLDVTTDAPIGVS